MTFTRLNKHSKQPDTVMADFPGMFCHLRERDTFTTRATGEIILSGFELLTLCRRAIKKGMIRKEDL